MQYPSALGLTRRLSLVVTTLALLSACASVPKPVSLADTIAKTPELSTLNGLVKTAGLTETLQAEASLTLFAPSDAAFKALKAGTIEELSKNPAKLKDLLTYHAIPGAIYAKDVKNSMVKAVNGDALALSKAGDFVTLENAMVTKADVVASNGVLHIIDAVMVPPKK